MLEPSQAKCLKMLLYFNTLSSIKLVRRHFFRKLFIVTSICALFQMKKVWMYFEEGGSDTVFNTNAYNGY